MNALKTIKNPSTENLSDLLKQTKKLTTETIIQAKEKRLLMAKDENGVSYYAKTPLAVAQIICAGLSYLLMFIGCIFAYPMIFAIDRIDKVIGYIFEFIKSVFVIFVLVVAAIPLSMILFIFKPKTGELRNYVRKFCFTEKYNEN